MGVVQGELDPEPTQALGTGRSLEAPDPWLSEKCDGSLSVSLHGKGSK